MKREGEPKVESEEEKLKSPEEAEIESEIEQLTDDEKTFLDLQEQRAKALHQFNWERSEEIISEEKQKILSDEISLFLSEKALPLQEKIGKERVGEIEDLRIKKLDMEVEKEISEAKDFDELIRAVYKTDGIQGTADFFTPDKLKEIINNVREGKRDIKRITRSGGLRERVEGLLKGEGGGENEGEPKVEEEGEEELGRVEVERAPAPWEKVRTEEEGRLIEEYAEKSQLSGKGKDSIENALKEEADRRKIEFAKGWFEEHRDEIKDKGYDVRTADESYMVRVTSELGGLKELRSKEEYREKNEEIENFYALRADLQKESIPIESQFLMLNALNKRGERIEDELDRAQAAGDKEAVKAKELQLEELSKTGRELAEKITGRNLRKEGEEGEWPDFLNREDYIQVGIDGRKYKVQEELGQMPKRIKEDRLRGIFCDELKWTTETRGLFRKRIVVRDENGKEQGSFTKKEADEFLRIKAEENRKKHFGEKWEGDNAERESIIKGFIVREVNALGRSPEKAEGGIEAVYGRVKERLITEFAEKDLKKKEKTKEELKTIEEEFKGKGKNPTEFIDSAIHRRGKLKELKGKWEEDEDNITEFLENWDFSVSPEALKGKKETIGKSYEKAVTKERGFLEWLLDFIFSYRPQEAEKPKEGGKGGKKARGKGK